MDALDLVRLDRDVARASEALRRFRAALAVDPEKASSDSLGGLRQVSGKNIYEAIATRPMSASEEPVRAGLLLWVEALTQARVGLDLEQAWAREAHAASGRVLLEVPRETSYLEAWRGVVFARDAATRRVWLDAAAGRAESLAPLARDRAARRLEVARRLGFEHAARAAAEAPVAVFEQAARGLLRETAGLRETLRRASEEHRKAETPNARLAAWIGDALATDAAEGWPARLTRRWLDESFHEICRGLRVTLDLPRAAGASSFARALYRFGVAARTGGRSGFPFVVSRSPDETDAHRFGFVFGGLAQQRVFQRKVLGLGARVAARQERSLARTALYEATWVAARWLIAREGHSASRHDWEEVTEDVFGGPVDGRFAGAWPDGRGDETARLEALLTAPQLADSLVSRFDIDWFRNPKAGQWLAARAGGPAQVVTEEKFDPVARAFLLARAFEEALG